MEITITDIIGVVAVAGGLAVLALGHDGAAAGIVVAVSSYYFGRRQHMNAVKK